MRVIQRVEQCSWTMAVVLLIVSCAGQKEPASKLVGEIEATVIAASSEASKYVPDQLAEVQSRLGGLKAAYDTQDYAGVVAGGPSVLAAAEELATSAAAKKDAVLKALDEEWTGLAGELPADVTAIQNRLELLEKKSGKKLAAGVDLVAGRSALTDSTSRWSKAQAAFAAGNLDEAVRTAKDVKVSLLALAAALKLDLAQPSATAGL